VPFSLQDELESELQALRAKHRLRECLPLDGKSRIEVQSAGERLVSFCSNDYLGLACHPSLLKAAATTLEASGVGASSSRLISGTNPVHSRLEGAIASLVGAPAALIFPTGYQANLGLLTSLAGPPDLIVADRAVHASIVDASRLSRAKLAVYPHLDVEEAARHLRRLGPKARRRFLITESLFSMDGDIAPLPDLSAIAEQHRAFFIVDEAHAIGIFGPRGSGLCQQLDVHPDALVGTFGKAMGASGAFVAGSQTLRDHLVNHARSFIFTTALPPPIAAAALEAVSIVSSHEGDLLRARLSASVEQIRTALSLTPAAPPTPIIPLIYGTDQAAIAASGLLRRHGLLVPAIRPPTVRPGTSRLRVSLSAAHGAEQLKRLTECVRQAPPLTGTPSRPLAELSVPSSSPPPPPPETPHPALRGLTILGTDTSVGKSTVAIALIHLLTARGHSPVPFKPVETGATGVATDTSRLQEAASRHFPTAVVCPNSFPQPVAPAAAAAAAGIRLSPAALLAAARSAAALGTHLVVETAGGLLTPYAPAFTSADLAGQLSLPVLLVARNALGTINHTALAISEIRRRSLPFVGYLLVNTTAISSPDQATNATLLQELTGTAPLGTLPHLQSATPAALAAALAAAADLSSLFSLLEPLT
jgi:8-amino-7-oxononanoate synthase